MKLSWTLMQATLASGIVLFLAAALDGLRAGLDRNMSLVAAAILWGSAIIAAALMEVAARR